MPRPSIINLPDGVRVAVEDAVGSMLRSASVGGGDVSSAARVEGERGSVFVKWGATGHSYAAEAEGLGALAGAAGPGVAVPAPLAVVAPAGGAPGGLVLPWIERGRPGPEDWRRFGAALAELHRAPAPGDGAYGWETDNWIGSKPQRNGWNPSWPAFFGERRLRAQARLVAARGAWNVRWDRPLDRLIARLPEILPDTPAPSLLHGDLWSGNALATVGGRFALIDPAVSVGHREADLAMTELFGGFAPAFYDGYGEAWPLDAGYPARREVYTLFHLINHLTHGPSYRRPVEAALRPFM